MKVLPIIKIILRMTNRCDREYKHAAGLQFHIKSAHECVTHNCNICQSTFTKKSSLTIHIKSVHFNKRYPCKICYYQATTTSDLSKHVKNVHQKSENIICTECNKCIQKKYLSTHMKMFHSEGLQTQYNCKICTYQSKHPSYVKKHVKNVHQKR